MTGDVVFVGKLMGHKKSADHYSRPTPSLHKAKKLIDRRNEEAAESLSHTLRHTAEISEATDAA